MDQRLRPVERLQTASDFRRAFDRGRYVSTPALRIHALPTEREFSRLGLVVSRKKAKRATERNRIKRLLRTAFRELKGELPGTHDIVLVPRGEGARSLEEYVASLRLGMERLRAPRRPGEGARRGRAGGGRGRSRRRRGTRATNSGGRPAGEA